MNPDTFSAQARLIGAVLAGSAWLSVCSLLFTATALLHLYSARTDPAIAMDAVIVGCGIIAAYVSLRISADRHIFLQLAADGPTALAQLDAALLEFGWIKQGKVGRNLAQRVKAALRFVYALAVLLCLQLAAWLTGLLLY